MEQWKLLSVGTWALPPGGGCLGAHLTNLGPRQTRLGCPLKGDRCRSDMVWPGPWRESGGAPFSGSKKKPQRNMVWMQFCCWSKRGGSLHC